MRFVNSVRNSAVMLLWQLLNVVAGFVLRTVFIKQLGFDYLGLNSVMESVLYAPLHGRAWHWNLGAGVCALWPH